MNPSSHHKEFTNKQIASILSRYQVETARQIADSIGRTVNSINSLVRRAKVKKDTHTPFSDFEIAIVMSKDKPKNIELILDRDRKSIIDKRYKEKNKYYRNLAKLKRESK